MRKKRMCVFAALLSVGMLAALPGCSTKKAADDGYIQPYEVEDALVKQGNYTEEQRQTLDFYPDAIKVVGDYARMKQFVEKCQAGKQVNICFIGGSVTKGESASIPAKSYPILVRDWLQARYPNAEIKLFQKGINGTGSVIGVERANRDIVLNDPDLIVVEFSVNDGNIPLDQEAYESMMRIFLSAKTEPAVIHLAHCNVAGDSSEKIHREICKYYNVPLVSMHAAFEKKCNKDSWYKDSVHPTDEGFQHLSNLITLLIADVEANLDNIGSVVKGLPKPMTDNGFMDTTSKQMCDLNITDWGDWKKENGNIVCTKAGGNPIVIETDCSYLLAKYEQNDNMDATVKAVTDGDEEHAVTINNHGVYYNVVTELCKQKTPAKHTVKIYMTKGDKFKMSTAYLSNFVDESDK